MKPSFNYCKLLKKAPKRFNYINYIEKTKGSLNTSGTCIEWPDGKNTRFSYRYGNRDLMVSGKTAKEAIILHYLISKQKRKNKL